MPISKVNLSRAEQWFGLANAPIFLLTRLRSDPAVQQLSRENTAKSLLAGIRSGVRKQPTTLGAAVRPYVYLVAISIQSDLESLKTALEIDAPYHDWYKYIAQVLITSMPVITTYQIVPMNNQIGSRPAVQKSNFGFTQTNLQKA